MISRPTIKVALVVCLSSSTAFALDESKTMELIPDHLAYLYSVPPPPIAENALRQLYASKRRWENGRRLRVCFYNGNPTVTKLVRRVASEWNGLSGVVLDFGPENTWFNCLSPNAGFPEIRVGFSERGYWSYVGSDSERYGGERAPSMNFESFNRIYNESQYSEGDVFQSADAYHKGTIRHEFGHALGLLHEHQNPTLNCFSEIKWNGNGNVYDYFGGSPNFWSREQVDRNLGFVGATDSDYVAGEADPKSIMIYSLSPSIFRNGSESKCAVPVSYEISEKDKLIVAKIYPQTSSGQASTSAPESIESAYVKPAPQFSSARDSSDYLKRAVVDLESDDTATRRNARARLAQVLSENTSTYEANQLVFTVPNANYRYKIGVATALGNADSKVELSQPAAAILKTQRSKESDQTLKNAWKKAQGNIEVK